MNDRTAFFYKPGETLRDTGSGFGLPPDLLEKSRRRVQIVGLLILFGAGLDLILMLIDLATGGRRADAGQLPSAIPFYGNILTVALSLALALVARSHRIRNALLLHLALFFEIVISLIISTTNPLSVYESSGALPSITWVTPLIIFYPLIVPCPPRRTLVTALLAAATRPLGILILSLTGKVPVDVGEYFTAAFSPTIAVVIAVFGSRVVYGLGREVAAARRMGSYQLERLLGSGGMGEVWLARHRMLARPAAVKLVRPELLGVTTDAERSQALRRFEREAQTTATLRSPHTIDLYDFGVAADGTFYYVMELLEGFDAETLVERFGPIPVERAVHILEQVCHSLAEAHEAGLVHRDIKPANIQVCRYGRESDFVKVLDFGLVKTIEEPVEESDLTAENVVHGTPSYMAPEQAMDRNRSDARADIYALGCVAYWLVTGSKVFEGRSAMEVLVHHARTAPVPPSARTPNPIPEPFEELILACLEKDPARRPQSALELSSRLAACPMPEAWTEERAAAWWQDAGTVPPAAQTG